jgi:hypothetical protein
MSPIYFLCWFNRPDFIRGGAVAVVIVLYFNITTLSFWSIYWSLKGSWVDLFYDVLFSLWCVIFHCLLDIFLMLVFYLTCGFAVYIYFCGLCRLFMWLQSLLWRVVLPCVYRTWVVCVSLVLMKSLSSRGVEFASCWFCCLYVTNMLVLILCRDI